MEEITYLSFTSFILSEFTFTAVTLDLNAAFC